MDDLVQWLASCLDEDEAAAQDALKRTTTTRRWIGGEWVEDVVQPPEWRRSVWDPARVLREIEAKRQLLTEVLRYEAKIDGEWGCCHDPDEIATGQCAETQPQDITALRLLALPFADRPGFREEWRP